MNSTDLRVPQPTVWAWWLGLAVMLVFEWLVFRAYYVREILPTFPRAFDQVAYLGETFDIFERIREGGILSGLRACVSASGAPGFLLQCEAAFGYFLSSPTRLSAISIAFAHLALLQAAILGLGIWAGRPLAALAVSGVTLTASLFYKDGGGLQDFRLDVPGFCLFAILGLAVVRSGGFHFIRPSLLAASIAVIAVFTRSIQLAYLCLMFLEMALLLVLLRRRDPLWKLRLRNMTLGASIAGLVIVGYVAVKWDRLVAYYVVGHVTSSEVEVRAREVGATSLVTHLAFYPRSAVQNQMGPIFIGATVLLLTVSSLRDKSSSRVSRESVNTPPLIGDVGWSAVFVASAIPSAYLVLTADIAKSPIVGNIFVAAVVPLLWLAACRRRGSTPLKEWINGAHCILIGVGLLVFATAYMRPASLRVTREEMSDYMALVDEISRTSAAVGLREPVISFDELAEYFHSGVVKVLAYERSDIVLAPQGALAGTLDALDRHSALELLARSDFAILGRDRAGGAGDLFFPVNRSLSELALDLYSWAELNMIPIREGAFLKRHVTLFMKPIVICTGNGGGWITSKGVECSIPEVVARSRSVVELSGVAPLHYLSGSLHAVVHSSTKQSQSNQCDFSSEALGDGNSRYSLRCAAPPMRADPGTVVRLRIEFDRFFVPKALGINDDPRELVLPWPAVTTAIAHSRR